MAISGNRNLLTLFGFVIWGDLGPTTMYRSKRAKLVWFSKTWPKKPPSEKQTYDRDRWKIAAALWRALSEAQRQQWELATRRASLCCHGYNLWMHWQLTGDDSAIHTLERQTNTTLIPAAAAWFDFFGLTLGWKASGPPAPPTGFHDFFGLTLGWKSSPNPTH